MRPDWVPAVKGEEPCERMWWLLEAGRAGSVAKNLPETVEADDKRVEQRKQLLYSQPFETQKVE